MTDIDAVLARLGTPRALQAQFAARFGRALVGTAPVWTGRAANGIGKTFGYLVPALLDGRRVAISVYTLTLLHQLRTDLAKVAEAVEAVTHRRVTWNACLSMSNFVSVSRVEHRLADASPEEQQVLCELLAFAVDRESSGLWQEFSDERGGLVDRINIADICLLPSCPSTEHTKWTAQCDATGEADVVLQTHATTFFQALRGQTPAEIVIVDEADRMLDLAASFDDVVTSNELIQLAKLLDLRTLIKEVARTKAWIGSRRVVAADEDIEASTRARALLAALASAHTDNPDIHDEVLDCRRTLLSFIRRGEGVAANGAAVVVRTWHGFLLRNVRTDQASGFARLWRAGGAKTVALVSATLDDSVAHGLGVRAEDLSVASVDMDAPGGFGALRFVLADRAAPTPVGEDGIVMPDFVAYTARMIAAARGKGGRVLVLVANFSDVDALMPYLSDAILHRQGGKLPPLIKQFLQTESAILVTPNAWEGVDLPGSIKHIVIMHVPFAPRDAAREAILDRVLSARGVALSAHMILSAANRATARRKLAQGIGRAVRTPVDNATIWIADPRFPIDDAVVRDRRRKLKQGQAVYFADLRRALPERFCQGLASAYAEAGLFR